MTQEIKLPPAWGSAINDTGDGHVDLYSKEQVTQIVEADRQAMQNQHAHDIPAGSGDPVWQTAMAHRLLTQAGVPTSDSECPLSVWGRVVELLRMNGLRLEGGLGEPLRFVADRQAMDWPAVEAAIKEYVADYEMVGEDESGQDGVYTPTEPERGLIEDAIHGLLADNAFIEALRPTPPADRQARGEPVAWWKIFEGKVSVVPADTFLHEDANAAGWRALVFQDAPQPQQQATGEPVHYVMSDEEMYESLWDAAVQHLDSNGINVIEPEVLDPLIRSLVVAIMDEAGFSPQPQKETGEPVPTVNCKGNLTSSLVWTDAGQAADLPHGTMLYTAPQPQQQASDPFGSVYQTSYGWLFVPKGETVCVSNSWKEIPVYTTSQPQQVPEGLAKILREASEIIAAIPAGAEPENIRFPIVDELAGFAAMLEAAPKPKLPVLSEQQRKLQIEDICRAYDVPPSIIDSK